MTSERIDRILLGLGALLILISSYQLFFRQENSNSGLKLGTLTSTLSVVKTKNALSLDWRDASSGNDLTENQLVYTDNESSAEIIFTEGTSLSIGENSLIKLSAGGREQSMDLTKGFIRAKLEGDKPLKVQMNGEHYVVSGTDASIQINLQNEKGEIGVLNGEVNVRSEGVDEKLTPETSLAIDGKKVQTKKIHLKVVTPSEAIKYVAQSPSEVEFSWTPSEEAKILISRNIALTSPEVLTGTSGVKHGLSEGLYYYRLENGKGISLTNSFRIVLEKPLSIIRPASDETVDVIEGTKKEVLLQWSNPQGHTVGLEWNDGEIHRAELKGSRRLVPIAEGDSFEWRVKVFEKNRPEAIWTQWQRVNVNLIKFPVLPVEMYPDDVEFQTYDKPNEKVELTWKSSHPVLLEIRDPAGKTFNEVVKTNSYSFIANRAGSYSWRLQSQDSYFRKSAWSEWKTFTVLDLSHEVSQEGIQKIQLKRPDQTITFNWVAEEKATSVFELAKDPEFKTIVKRTETKSDSAQVHAPVVGVYYWRSKQYLENGTFNVSKPKRVVVEPGPAIVKPPKLPDVQVPLQELPLKSSSWDFLNFIIPVAYADETKGRVSLELPSSEDGKAFIVRIYRDKELTDLVFEKEVSNRLVEWDGAEPGSYYWQYAVIDYWDRKSLFSDPSQLTVTYENVPPAEKVKLLSPIRAQEARTDALSFHFSGAQNAVKYRVELSGTKDFHKVIQQKTVKTPKAHFNNLNLSPALYYWRVFSINRKNAETMSNTGRFSISPPLEKTIIADFPREAKKLWQSRGLIQWVPSMDRYTFKNGETGEISGSATMGIALSGTVFKDSFIYSGEILRQSGKVFDDENYLFQRLTFDGVKSWDFGAYHKVGLGVLVGHVSGSGYEIVDSVVSAKSITGLNYGPIIRDFYIFNEKWEAESNLMYLLGEIQQIELGSKAIRHWKNYLFSAGFDYAIREYETSSGKQTSLRLSFGIGKEF